MSSKKSGARLFWVSGAKGCRGSSSYRFWEKFNLSLKFKFNFVNSSETQMKRKEHGIVVVPPLQSVINDQVEKMRVGISLFFDCKILTSKLITQAIYISNSIGTVNVEVIMMRH